ncbi:hypothetical protein G5V58_24795 [Nocardioides anomalus]|uniref:Uncharacterized protein n=1 Tax=Nocardioides anomalus TaxID=2712223 RepID=A0A6G6WKB4_9ACTN|nr:hypothetical protein [Nocardioides anomalus]QIG45535.1 hypothetical protein G5V58_24795 [Nocardioides anomalus]
MNPSTRLAPALDERLTGLPAVPPEHYLGAGRRAVRRRRVRRTAVAGVLVAGVVAAGAALLPGGGPEAAVERPPAVAARPAPAGPSWSTLRVEDGVGGIDSFTTSAIPSWASEYGNHGPAAIAPDGRLWVAPDATVVRTIADPVVGDPAVTHSYAVEAQVEGSRVWSFVYQEEGVPGTFGRLDDPGRWTVDFGIWAENEAAGVTDAPGVAERLASFADTRSADLVPGPGVTMVRQVAGVALPGRPLRARRVAAQVLVQGQTWFVLGVGKRDAVDYYEAYDATSVGADDLDGFVAFLSEDA